MKPKKLILDYSKWRSGRGGINKVGEGPTTLLNSLGYMCCLGQWCQQLGIPDNELRGKQLPDGLNIEVKPLNYKSTGIIFNSNFSEQAITINDETKSTPDEKIMLLNNLLASEGIELEVINKPK